MLTDRTPNQEFKNKTDFPDAEIGLRTEQADDVDTFPSIDANTPGFLLCVCHRFALVSVLA